MGCIGNFDELLDHKKIEEQENNIREFNKRFNNGITFILYYEDFIILYLYTLKLKEIDPDKITYGEIIQYSGLLLKELCANNVHVIMNLDDMEIEGFYKKQRTYFKRIENEDTEIVSKLSITEIWKQFIVYIPYPIIPSIVNENIRNKAKEIYVKTHGESKGLTYHNKDIKN